MNQTVEVFLFLHSIEHGTATFTVGKTLGAKKRLPILEIEMVPHPSIAAQMLVKIPTWLAVPMGLMPATNRAVAYDPGGMQMVDKVSPDKTMADSFANAMTTSLKESLDAERRRGDTVRTASDGPNHQSIAKPAPRFRPAYESTGNAAGSGLLSAHRARSQVEQISADFVDSGIDNDEE